MQRESKKLEQRRDQLIIDMDNYKVIMNLLKDDGIKSRIVRKYLPVMNKFIHSYLKELDFSVFFSLDEEFNETVKSPLYQDVSYYSFSEGQKARINIALLLTWREIAKLKNSVNCNLLFFDETFSSSLDTEGRDCLFSLLKYKLQNTNVFVVDHTLDAEFRDRFDRCIEVSLVNGFSKYS
jgi:DNA repair exonuclease SbcCD ATPase subunit